MLTLQLVLHPESVLLHFLSNAHFFGRRDGV